jgi:molybdopterin molybdotransferase
MQDSGTLLPSSFTNGSALSGFDPARLLSPERAIAAFFARATIVPPRIEEVSLQRARGRVLARDAVSREDHPTHPRSTMDGFAFASASGLSLRVVGEVLMGHAPERAVGPNEAMRVPTGGALPAGADAVVPQEDVTIHDDGTIELRERVAPWDCVTPRAEDVRSGEMVLGAGRRLGAPELGVLATLGIANVPVFARPRVAILSTGDELVDPSSDLHVGQVRDSNRYAIGAALEALGAAPVHLPRSLDTPEALGAAMRAALDACDAVITTGGSSVGERDLVPRIVAELGAPGPIVHGLRVKPGKPTLLAAVGPKPVIGLPGNPTSALMIFEAIVRPIVTALCGERAGARIVLHARASAPFSGRAGWTWFVPALLRARDGAFEAEPLALRSAHTSLLARASGYATLEAEHSRIEIGEYVNVSLFSCGGAPIGVV